MCARLNLEDVDVTIVLIVVMQAVLRYVHGHRLHVSECLLWLFLRSLIIELFLGLLNGPLKLPREDSHVVVCLQAIAVRENVHNKLGS